MSDAPPDVPGGQGPSINPIFSKFVDGTDSPIPGYVAYGIYKSRKREWATEIHARTGQPPTSADLAAYHVMWTSGLIENTRDNAEQALGAYADDLIAEATPGILRDALKGRFSRDIVVSILASFIYTLILVMLALILAFSGVDLLGIFTAIRNWAGSG